MLLKFHPQLDDFWTACIKDERKIGSYSDINSIPKVEFGKTNEYR